MEEAGGSSPAPAKDGRFEDVDGLRWHVRHAGRGPDVLLVHGTGSSLHSWRDIVPPLSVRHSVWSVDLPGHGSSAAAAPAQCSIDGMSRALGSLLERLSVRPAFVVGHSAGAVILCRMALDARIAPRVIVAVNGAFIPLAGPAGRWFAPAARLAATLPLLPRLLARQGGNRARVARLIAATGSTLTAEGLDHYVRLVGDPKHVAGALCMMGQWDLAAFERQLPRLDTPLTLMVGDHDLTVPPAQAEWVRGRVRAASIRHLPGLGHLAHEEAPAQTARALIEIFESYPVSSPADASTDPSGRSTAD